MKTVLQIGFVAFLIGGLSTAGTVYWQRQQADLHAALTRAEAAEKKAAENPLDDMGPPATSVEPVQKTPEPDHESEVQPEPPVAVRPPYVEGVDETSRLIVSLNERLAATFEKEKKLHERQEALKLIFADIRAEQVEIAQLRKQLGTELDGAAQSVQDALDAAEKEREILRQELDGLRRSNQDTKTTVPPADASVQTIPTEPISSAKSPATKGDDATTSPAPTKTAPSDETETSKADALVAQPSPAVLKRMGAIYDSMPPEVVAEVFQQLAKGGRQDAVVQLLKAMKDRQAAKVLTSIAEVDPASAATLTDKLKRD